MILSCNFIKSDEDNCEMVYTVFTDIDKDDWFYDEVTSLYKNSVIPGESDFRGDESAKRRDIVLYLYNLARTMGKDVSVSDEIPFEDVAKDYTYHTPISWAYANGIVKGADKHFFKPLEKATKEQLCTIVVRFLEYMDIKPSVTGDAKPFNDSLTVSRYARSYVVSAKLAGIIEGDGNNYFKPFDSVTRGELASMVYKIFTLKSAPYGREFVSTQYGAYTPYYIEYIKGSKSDRLPTPDGDFEAYVSEGKAVDVSYFDDAAFVGDSVSMSLQFYCASSKALGKATFLCAGSLSPLNAHWAVTNESKHPVYKGEKLTVEDAVKKCGAKKVYVMLGINSLGFGFDECVRDMENLIWKILEKSPDAQIIIQSVTPMTKDSPIYKPTLNNNIIYNYNSKLLEMCNRYGWYYVNSAQAVSDKEGYLKKEYCSDPKDMGIHFNFEADKAWVEYLKTHAPRI